MSSEFSISKGEYSEYSTEEEKSEYDDKIKYEEEDKEPIKESNLCPFELLWSVGLNSDVPLINLTTKNRTLIAYSCSHIVIIYNYETKEALNLQGHKNTVRTLSTSMDGKWLLSADFEEDCVVVVWDTETGVPISTLFNPHGDQKMTAVKISPNAKYIVTVGNEFHQKVHFWLWTYGKDKPDKSVEITEFDTNRIKEIAFNNDCSEEFVLIADYNVVFFKWEQEELKFYVPQILGKIRRYGIFNCSCFISKSLRVLTATTYGYIVVWDISADKDKTKSIANKNKERKYIKSVKLEKSSILVIVYKNGKIVTGSLNGRITFYDQDLKILYWCEHELLDGIRSISFDFSSSLLAPACESDFEYDEEEYEEKEEMEDFFSEITLNGAPPVCNKKRKEFTENLKLKYNKMVDKIPSTLTVNLEILPKKYYDKVPKKPMIPTEATVRGAPFYFNNFFISCLSGTVASIEIPTFKCRFIFRYTKVAILSFDVHPRSNYVVTGDANGYMCLYDYEKRKIILREKTPPFPDFRPVMDKQVKSGHIIYITCPFSHEGLNGITALKYSQIGDILVCGLENGTLWMLHPITLEPIDKNPYKHSMQSIHKLAFSDCGEYLAYADNTLVVAVFKKNHKRSSNDDNIWNFIGKYRSHNADIKDILFGPATIESIVYRLFSIAEDKTLIEYNLKDSGPYPVPGLKILDVYKIENDAIPFCLEWYPHLGIEGFLAYSTSEYKFRLLNDMTKLIRGTFMGPLYGSPVKQIKILSSKDFKALKYMVFATDKEIGLQILPFDGNPYKTLGMIGHPHKITHICVNTNGNLLFTSGYNDPSILIWKIKYKSVDVLAHLGGKGLSPYYCLIEGGKNGWLIKEMQDLFYYSQILHQGENITSTRIISDKVNINELPNLMRSIGYYPSNEEIENFMGEVAYRDYAETGNLVDNINFEDFVKLYINHRPYSGISKNKILEAFRIFSNQLHEDDPFLTRDQFMRLLLGHAPYTIIKKHEMPFGEPLTVQEAFTYMKFLIGFEENFEQIDFEHETSMSLDFTFLPEMISYKYFITDILGIEFPEETRADDDLN